MLEPGIQGHLPNPSFPPPDDPPNQSGKGKGLMKGLEVSVGCAITFCKDCERNNKAIEIANMFEWPTSLNSVITYDRENQEILLVKERVMHIIQMINPVQQARKIRLISEEEWKERITRRDR
ncbi:MAG: hypothetical protein ABFD08_08025 [Syntrophomonas sp.]